MVNLRRDRLFFAACYRSRFPHLKKKTATHYVHSQQNTSPLLYVCLLEAHKVMERQENNKCPVRSRS